MLGEDNMQDKVDKKTYYIIVGCMYLVEDEEHLRKNYIKRATSVSNNVFERKLYSGFEQSHAKSDFVFLSAPSVGWFPKNCKKIKMTGFSKKDNYHPVSYTTTYIGSTFSKSNALKKELSRVIRKIDLNQYKICLVLNELHLPYLQCARYLKKRIPDCITLQLVPDLPEFNNRSTSKIYRFLKKINCDKINQLRNKYIDKYVLFSQPMAERLHINDLNNWIVNYGIAPDNHSVEIASKDNKKHIVFIGKIDKRNGADLILEAAKLFKERKDVVFDFYGIGASDSVSSNFGLNCTNVIMHGFLNPSSVQSVLNSADVLLSPRYPDEEYTYYSFPSKNI